MCVGVRFGQGFFIPFYVAESKVCVNNNNNNKKAKTLDKIIYINACTYARIIHFNYVITFNLQTSVHFIK